jgi:hypothetical protein
MQPQATALRVQVPYNQLDISIVYRSMNRRVERDQHCTECGMPTHTISDKAVVIYDGGTTTEMLRTEQRQIGIICKRQRCAQHFQLEV